MPWRSTTRTQLRRMKQWLTWIQLMLRCKSRSMWWRAHVDFYNLIYWSRNKRIALHSIDSPIRLSVDQEFPPIAVNSNSTKCDATTKDDYNAMEAFQSRSTTSFTPSIYNSLTDDESDDAGDPVKIDVAEMLQGEDSTQKHPTGSIKLTRIARKFKFKCMAPKKGRCKDSFDSEGAMKHHVTNYHAKGIKNTYECHLCRKSFAGRQVIQRHSQSVHTGLRPFMCPSQSCWKRFASKLTLKRHVDSIHGRLQPFVCPNQLCSKRFSYKCNLNRHIDSIHSGLKPYRCPTQSCSKMCSQKNELKQHIDSVHLGLKPFECPNRSCSMRFSHRGNLNRHIKSFH